MNLPHVAYSFQEHNLARVGLDGSPARGALISAAGKGRISLGVPLSPSRAPELRANFIKFNEQLDEVLS